MATLIEQNLRRLEQIQRERILEELDENYGGESNVHARRNERQGAPRMPLGIMRIVDRTKGGG
jgi:hypothetical protein